ncbi:hypothetical protein PENTCL1PPCAC_18090, partial [Pristionchus entomophagus]
FLLSTSFSFISLHFLLSFSIFEYTNTFYLSLSALYCIFDYFTCTSKVTPAFLTDRRVLLSSFLLALSLLLSYESYDIGRFHRWQSILLSTPHLFDGRSSRLLVATAAISGFLSFHLISTKDNPIDTPLFLPWLSSDRRSIIAGSSLIYATVNLSREKLEPDTLSQSLFSVILITTVIREFFCSEIHAAAIYYSVLSLPSFIILLIFSIISVPISIRSFGHQLISYDHPLSHVFIGFYMSRLILLLISRGYLILSDQASFLSSLPS